MKKVYFIVGMSLISLGTFAQTAVVSQVKDIQNKNGAKAGLGFPNTGSVNRAVFLAEDFSGTFPPTGWTVQSETGSTVTNAVQRWHLEQNGNPGGCASVLYFNSVDQHNESLITPDVALPPAGFYRVAFDFNTSQYWHLPDGVLGGNFDNADITVRVSTDGGTTWSNVLWQEDDQALGEAAYAWPWSQYVWKRAFVNLNAYAGQTVKIRWNYNGMDGAQFNLDNISVEDIPTNDLVLTDFSIGPYTSYPEGQERQSTLWAKVQNRGALAQTGVTLEVEENGTSVGTSAPVANLAVGATDSLTATTTYQPSGVGVKNLELIFDQTETEAVPADNSITTTMEVSENKFSRDRNIYTGAGWADIVIGANSAPVTAVGTFYEIVADAQATSISVVLAGATEEGAEIRAELFDASGSELVTLGESDIITVTAADINTAATNTPVAKRLELFTPVDLTAGGVYFAAVWQEGGDTVSVAREERRIEDVLVFAAGDINDWTGLTNGGYVPLLRLNLNESSNASIAENKLSAISVFPNPASDVVNVKFAEVSGDITVQLFSADGKQVMAGNSNVVSGQTATFDVSGLASGIYTLRVNGTNGAYTQKVIVK